MNYSNNIFHRLFTDHNRLRVVVFMLFASCILAVSLTFFILSIGRPNMGVTLSLSDQYWTVEKVDRNSLASQAGIRKGDRPIEIDGQLAETFLERYSNSGLVFSALFRELTVVDDNGQLKSVSLKEESLPWQGVIQQISWLFVSVIFWVVGFYVFLKRPRNVASSLLCLIGLFVGLMLTSNMAWIAGVSIAAYSEVLATAVGPWLLLHFFLALPEERAWLHHNPLVYAIYFPVAITLVLFPLIGLDNGQPVLWFQNVRYLEAGVGLLAVTGVAVFNYFGATSMRTRQQMKIVAVACFAALIPFSVLNLFPAAVWRQSILPPEFSILLVSFIPVGMGYAIVTQKLMNIDVFIRRGVIYALITLVMAAIFSTAITAITVSHMLVGIEEKIVIGLVLGIIATALFGPIRNGVEVMVDKLFYKDRYDYRQTIQSVTTSLNSTHDLNGMSRLIVGTVVKALNLAGSCLFMKLQSDSFEVSAAQGAFMDAGKQSQLLTLISQQNRTIEFPNSASNVCPDLAFLIPLLAEEREVGILCVSQKVSRQDFSSNDIYLLQEIGSVAAISLHSAMLTRDVSIRDTFVSVASHELRTPLTSIVGYADLLLRRDPPDATRKRWLKNILDSSQRVSAMVDELLNVSRIQSGRTGMKLEEVGLSEVFEDTLCVIHESTKKHEFVVDIDPDLPGLLVDREKFGQVIGNLLSNAVKYSPNGGRITLSAHNEPSDHRIIVSVTDEGIGIGPEDKKSLFTTFHRIQRPETKGIRGSGLGLYIAKEWTEAMGGKIWLESELNKGSTFFIAIPMQGSSGTG
jgi:signal transduction histidine kinase